VLLPEILIPRGSFQLYNWNIADDV
jgi:hypothetical protein